MSRLEIPKLQVIEFGPVAGVSEYLQRKVIDDYSDEYIAEHGIPPLAGGASFSDFLENTVLDAYFEAGYLALCTSVPTDASTGTTIVEANYTGYARKQIVGSDMSAAASGSKTNSATITFAACTSGSSTVIGWAFCDAATVGNVHAWGTATSTVISTTQTPATVAIGGLVVNLD